MRGADVDLTPFSRYCRQFFVGARNSTQVFRVFSSFLAGGTLNTTPLRKNAYGGLNFKLNIPGTGGHLSSTTRAGLDTVSSVEVTAVPNYNCSRVRTKHAASTPAAATSQQSRFLFPGSSRLWVRRTWVPVPWLKPRRYSIYRLENPFYHTPWHLFALGSSQCLVSTPPIYNSSTLFSTPVHGGYHLGCVREHTPLTKARPVVIFSNVEFVHFIRYLQDDGLAMHFSPLLLPFDVVYHSLFKRRLRNFGLKRAKLGVNAPCEIAITENAPTRSGDPVNAPLPYLRGELVE